MDAARLIDLHSARGVNNIPTVSPIFETAEQCAGECRRTSDSGH